MPHVAGHNPHFDSAASNAASSAYNTILSSQASNNYPYGGSTSQIKENIKKKVKKDIGFTAVGGIGQTDQNYIAANADNPLMYGGATSTAINEALVDAGYGTFNEATGSYNLTAEGWKMKYGSYTPGQAQTGSAMGTGNPNSILGSIPISSAMLQHQNQFLGLATMAASMVMPSPINTIMRVSGGKNLVDAAQPKEAYQDYLNKFSAKQKGKKFTSDRTIMGLLGLKNNNKTKKDTLG